MSKQSYVIAGILALTVILAVTMSHMTGWVFSNFGWDDFPVLSREVPISKVIGALVAICLGAFALLHKPTVALSNEIAEELSKVSWPSREETGHATVVVLATVALCAAYLGLFDAVWLWLTNLVLGVQTTPPTGG